ncbi:type II toxin-antitoxin system RelE/ParE family toxin [Scytonema sp. PCC 10023]|uniref:type II toxin-antitoxin system RelE/ParE family toxin n=1 Tax=Scytonema sp. PCC 10023 TaxID=1680591 RepID=UPI0039C6F994
MSRYIISLEASRDLEEIIDYFASRNVEAGERFVNEFNKKCENLAKFPSMGRSYAEIVPSLRGVPLNGYIILYQVLEDGIVIVRVISGYRNLESLFSDSDD